jgi:hypothetical protein
MIGGNGNPVAIICGQNVWNKNPAEIQKMDKFPDNRIKSSFLYSFKIMPIKS